jgi:hypothetical protein
VPERLVPCRDGIWNTSGRRLRGRPCPTIVTEVARGVAPATPGGSNSASGARPGSPSPAARVRAGRTPRWAAHRSSWTPTCTAPHG